MTKSKQQTVCPSFDIEYLQRCPECAQADVSSALGLVSGVGIVCAQGEHFFTDLPPETLPESKPENRLQVDAPVSQVPEAPAGGEIGKPSAGDLLHVLPPPELWLPFALPGGGVRILIDLPETFYNGLLCEAEAQRLTFSEYFRDWIARASENQWT